ncbi:hypothetical protein QN372_01475 [Undibacterium sp. RTI2.1]|uniref:hypothetical protein n=1 Tax=unclassified Undibacterium TaxID=2630295 RepID=UPI002B22887C|nr:MULTISPECIES: hypothetical protein [unclassified Undibacterium]MEB0029409.1 hypothetical protein [Undibacterium sp. RTI2.1]MEB0115972.1 hypothetical protein [Undibacterium sp. RTI2.2]
MTIKTTEKWALYDTQPAFVLGFHGCDQSVGERILAGEDPHLIPSENDYDWLGHGIYFWEANPQRALEFAHDAAKNGKVSKGKINNPFVLGAIINLGACLNLTNSASLHQVKVAYEVLDILCTLIDDTVIPKNSGDLLRRKLDCAVFETLHQQREEGKLLPYRSVRGVFWEGEDLYPGAGFKEKNHLQLCVRDTSCILGYFRPIELS